MQTFVVSTVTSYVKFNEVELLIVACNYEFYAAKLQQEISRKRKLSSESEGMHIISIFHTCS